MIQLIVMFILIQLTLFLRYLVFDAFEPATYWSTYALLVAAVAFYFVGKSFRKQELAYVPKNQTNWSFLSKQKRFPVPLPLYKGDERRGSLQQLFKNKWHYIAADFIHTFALSFRLNIDNDTYEVHATSLFTFQNYWLITKNGMKIGEAKTVVDLKNSVKLTEVIEVIFEDVTYTTAAYTVAERIELKNGQTVIGSMKRSHQLSHIHELSVLDSDDEARQLVTLILHSLQFKS